MIKVPEQGTCEQPLIISIKKKLFYLSFHLLLFIIPEKETPSAVAEASLFCSHKADRQEDGRSLHWVETDCVEHAS